MSTDKIPEDNASAPLLGLGLSEGLGPDDGCKQATPYKALMAQLLNPNVPKTDREHAAVREIERLRAWVEEAVSYVGCETWSPSLKEEGEALLLALGPNVRAEPETTA